MANCCFTTYKITGTKKAIMNLDQTLESMNVNTEDVLLADLADRYGIDYLNRRIAVRGHIFKAVNESNADKDYYMLSIETETAGAGCHRFFYALKKVLDNELCISYREIESGCDRFRVHDEDEFFKEECCVSSSGEPFEEWLDEPVETIYEAIKLWCTKMGVERGYRSEEEMIEYINNYVYKNSNTYYYINPFLFE